MTPNVGTTPDIVRHLARIGGLMYGLALIIGLVLVPYGILTLSGSTAVPRRRRYGAFAAIGLGAFLLALAWLHARTTDRGGAVTRPLDTYYQF